MNTTPIEAGIGAITGGTVALCLLVLLVAIGSCLFVWKKTKSEFKVPIIISVMVIGLAGTVATGAVMVEDRESKRAGEVKAHVSSLGFEFVSGEIAVYPGTDKDFTVSKYDEEFQCTSYAPDSVNDKIFLVCDTAVKVGKGSIEDLSMQLDGMKTREDAGNSTATTANG